MLDAYIIERIRREQEQSRQRDVQVPLHIEPPRPPPPALPPREQKEEVDERGSVVIDFHV